MVFGPDIYIDTKQATETETKKSLMEMDSLPKLEVTQNIKIHSNMRWFKRKVVSFGVNLINHSNQNDQ